MEGTPREEKPAEEPLGPEGAPSPEESTSQEEPEPTVEPDHAEKASQTQLRFDRLEAQTATITGKQEIFAIQANFNESEEAFRQKEGIFGSLFGPARPLDLSRFDEFSLDEMRHGLRKPVYDPKEIEAIAQRLEELRILFLVGPSGLGKRQVVVAVATCLGQRIPSLRRIWKNKREIDHRLRVDWSHFLQGEVGSRDSVFILHEALHSGNRDVERLVSSSDELHLEKLRGILWDRNSFLLVTGDDDKSPHFSTEMRRYQQILRSPEWSLLSDHLRERARTALKEEYPDRATEELIHLLDNRLRCHRKLFEKELDGVAKVEWFVERSLVGYLEADDSTEALEAAFSRLDSVHGLVRQSAERGVEDLAAVLALACCFPPSRRSGTEWLVFERLRGVVSKALDDELRHTEPKEAIELLGESEVLRRLGVEITSERGSMLLELADSHQSTRLWRALFEEGRRVLTICEPLLARLAVARGEESLATRQTATLAWIELSALGSHSILGRRFSGWLTETSDATLETARWVVEWVFETQKESMRTICLQVLDRRLEIGPPQRIARAVHCLGAVGEIELSTGLDRLREALGRQVLSKLEEFPTVTAAVRGLANRTVGPGDATSRAETSRSVESVLAIVLARSFGNDQSYRILNATQFVLVGWILRHGAISVFRQLDRWMPDGEETDRTETALLSLLFLRSDVRNALAVLDGISWSHGPTETSWNPILADAAQHEHGATVVAGFLFKLLLGTRRFPALIQKDLRRSLWTQLDSWLAEEEDDPDRRSLQVELWRRLARIPDRELRDEIADFLRDLQLRNGSGAWLRELESALP